MLTIIMLVNVPEPGRGDIHHIHRVKRHICCPGSVHEVNAAAGILVLMY